MVRADGARFPFPFLRAALLRVSAPPRETGFHEKSHDPSQQILRRPPPLPPNPPAPAVAAAQDDARTRSDSALRTQHSGLTDTAYAILFNPDVFATGLVSLAADGRCHVPAAGGLPADDRGHLRPS